MLFKIMSSETKYTRHYLKKDYLMDNCKNNDAETEPSNISSLQIHVKIIWQIKILVVWFSYLLSIDEDEHCPSRG